MSVVPRASQVTLTNGCADESVVYKFEPTRFERSYSWGYLLVRGVLSGAISGGINYGLAVAMYSAPNPPPHAYQLPSTILGDLVVTTIIQGFLIWIITVVGTFGDLRAGVGLPYIAESRYLDHLTRMHANDKPLEKPKSFNRWSRYWILPANRIDVFAPSIDSKERMARFNRNLKLAGYSAFASVPVFVLAAMVIIFSIYGVGFYDRRSAMVMKAVFAGVCGFISSNLFTWIVLVGWQLDCQSLEIVVESKPDDA